WTYPARQQEVTPELVEELRTAYLPDAWDMLDSLRQPPLYIRATGNSMMIPMTLEGLHNLKGYTVAGLVDSGATNGFIHQKFVEEQGLDVEPLLIAVPLYNAEGTLNKGGQITHTTRMRLRIQDHSEVCTFAVTDTG
ncbi:hypothetical protein B0H12DRAFT_982569, partial [Mycena haematopus]